MHGETYVFRGDLKLYAEHRQNSTWHGYAGAKWLRYNNLSSEASRNGKTEVLPI